MDPVAVLSVKGSEIAALLDCRRGRCRDPSSDGNEPPVPGWLSGSSVGEFRALPVFQEATVERAEAPEQHTVAASTASCAEGYQIRGLHRPVDKVLLHRAEWHLARHATGRSDQYHAPPGSLSRSESGQPESRDLPKHPSSWRLRWRLPPPVAPRNHQDRRLMRWLLPPSLMICRPTCNISSAGGTELIHSLRVRRLLPAGDNLP